MMDVLSITGRRRHENRWCRLDGRREGPQSDCGIVFLVTPGQSDKTSPARCSDKPLEIPGRIESGNIKKRREESVLRLTGSFVRVQDRVEASEQLHTDRPTGSLPPRAAECHQAG